jgi:thiol-disulfide isomerase/thioredoxin
MVAPAFDKVADNFEEHPIEFVKFDIGVDKESAQAAGIKSLPTI